MSGTGTAIVDFGSDIASNTSLDVTGQGGISSGSLVEAWVGTLATTDHLPDEHVVEELQVRAGNIVAGVGFTIYLVAMGPKGAYGKWTVHWVWF